MPEADTILVERGSELFRETRVEYSWDKQPTHQSQRAVLAEASNTASPDGTRHRPDGDARCVSHNSAEPQARLDLESHRDPGDLTASFDPDAHRLAHVVNRGAFALLVLHALFGNGFRLAFGSERRFGNLGHKREQWLGGGIHKKAS
jgi:hypothetical protein